MALTNAFYEAVKSGNVRRVRIMMQDSLLVDPTFTEFNAMEKAAASMAGLYDEHDGKEFVEDRTLWNDDYMDKVMVKVLSNFSHERIEHLKEVVRYLRPVTKTVTPKRIRPVPIITIPHAKVPTRKKSVVAKNVAIISVLKSVPVRL